MDGNSGDAYAPLYHSCVLVCHRFYSILVDRFVCFRYVCFAYTLFTVVLGTMGIFYITVWGTSFRDSTYARI